MLKFITSAVLASSFALTSAHEAAASGGGQHNSGAKCDVQPTAPAAPAAKPDLAPKSPATVQNPALRYRSYSYHTAPANGVRQMPNSARGSSSFYDQFRADRKVRGLQ